MRRQSEITKLRESANHYRRHESEKESVADIINNVQQHDPEASRRQEIQLISG